MKRSFSVSALLLASTCVSCGSDDQSASPPKSTAPCGEAATPGAPFGVQCGQLVDEQGRIAFLRGVNARIDGVFDVTFDDGRVALEEVPAFDASDVTQLREFGFDALRLPINWSAIEPTEDGGFNESYLLEVDRVVELCGAADIQVLLDLHQDAFSKEIGEDGAPLWAIEPPPEMLLEGPLDDLGDRRLSAQVLAAFETFFSDSATGAELRRRFSQMAAHVAARYADAKNVVGVEIFNEPQSNDAGIARLNQVAYPSIREASPKKLYVYEPPVTRNFTDRSTLADGPLGNLVGYAPHVYTYSFTATDEQKASIDKEKLRRSNANARDEANALQAPLIITEWGIDPLGVKADEYLTWQSELQEEYMASSFFWVWKEQSQGRWGCFDYDDQSAQFSPREAVKRSLARVRPSRVAGWPERFAFDRTSGIFELDFQGDPSIQGPHVIAIAPRLGAPLTVSCDGEGIAASELGRGEYAVECGHDDSKHRIRVEVSPLP
ncbi:MAG: cellulase family glycosylhydrolase [Polyangiaceae bacterium]